MELKNCRILGLNVRYLETSGMGTPLLLLHGWGSSVNSWRNVANVLEEKRVKALIPDLPGFGGTQEPKTPWNLSDYISFVRAFSAHLGPEKFALAGHSFGGQIAIGYAAQYPEQIEKLILISAARIVRRRTLKVNIFKIFSKLGNLAFSVPPLYFIRPMIQKIWYKFSGEKDYYRASKIMRKTMSLVLDCQMRDELKKIKTPTLIIWGEKDPVTPLADAKILHREIRKSALDVFPGENHDLNMRVPQKLGENISDYLQ